MEEISLIEKVLGRPYGKTPRIVETSIPRDRFNEYIKANRRDPDKDMQAHLFATDDNKGSVYFGKTHTLILPIDDGTEKRYLDYAKLHELGHGYLDQKFLGYDEIGQKLLDGINGKLSKEELEKSFLRRCVDEGVADYIAIEAQKLEVEQGKSVDEVYCYDREWVLANFETLKEGDRYTESIPLSKEVAESLEGEGDFLINKIIDRNKEGDISDAEKSIMASCMQDYAYVFGHYLIRTICNETETDMANCIHKIIANPPETIKELTEMVLSYFK